MFDRATCSAMQITTAAPVVEFAALVVLHGLLGVAAALSTMREPLLPLGKQVGSGQRLLNLSIIPS
jgi:hypothetical protein